MNRTNEYRAKGYEFLSLAETMNDPERRADMLRYARTRIGRNGASSRSGVYDRQIMRTMRLVGDFKTTIRTATAEQSFWPYGRSARGVATSSTATAIDLIRRDHLRQPDRRAALRCGSLKNQSAGLAIAGPALFIFWRDNR
jgi:hypothetical protein